MISVRTRVGLTVMVVTACLYSLLAGWGFLRITHAGRDSIRERVGVVMDELEADLRAGTSTVQLTTADGVLVTITSPSAPIAPTPGRIVVTRTIGLGGRDVVLVGSASEARLTDSLRSVHRGIWIAVPLAVLVTTAASWIAVGRALRPVSSITALAAGIGASDLSRRVPVPATDDEIAELADTVNAMLARIEAGRLVQRRFTSDAAHELRTPLMVLQGEIELARRAGGDGGGGDADPGLLDRLDREARRLAERVDDLMLLSTLDEHPPMRTAPTDLLVLVLDEVAAEPDAVAPGVPPGASPRVAVSGDGVVADVDDRLVQRAVVNLVANARRHAAHRVAVVVSADAEADATRPMAWIHVDDDGPGIAEADRVRVFGRFDRLDDARSTDRGGSGLGLAIVASVAEAHGGRTAVTQSPWGGARVSIGLPCRTAPPR